MMPAMMCARHARSPAMRQHAGDAECLLKNGVQGSDFFASFDTDGDGVISFSEYQLVLMLLAIPLEVLPPPPAQWMLPSTP